MSHFNRWVLSAALLLAPAIVSAQASYQFTDFVNTANGFTTTLLYRNINQLSDPNVVTLEPSFVVRTSARVKSFCSGLVTSCSLIGQFPTYTSGPVRTNDFSAGDGTLFVNSSNISEDSCAADYCLSRAYSDVRVLGCQTPAASVPGGIIFYTGQTCDALGYTGSLALNMLFTYQISPSAASAAFVFDASDISADFNTRDFGPSAVVPEPASWMLTALGLALVGFATRRRKRAL